MKNINNSIIMNNTDLNNLKYESTKRKIISIIIPVYNTERYLSRCLDSILCQINDDCEIIIINDGSTDGSQQIIEQYKRKFDNIIRSYYQENSGVSCARNVGMEKSIGDYVFFVDSDDYISKGIIEKIINAINNNNVDVIEIGYKRFDGVNDIYTYIPECQNLMETGSEYLKESLKNKDYKWYAVRFICKKTFLYNYNLKFPVGIRYEDVYFTPRMLNKAKSLIRINSIGYVYCVERSDSITRETGLGIQNDIIYIANENNCFFSGNDTLSKMIRDNSSSLYFNAMRNYFFILDKREKKIAYKLLKDNKSIVNNIYYYPRTLGKFAIKILGLRFSIYLLMLRERMR